MFALCLVAAAGLQLLLATATDGITFTNFYGTLSSRTTKSFTLDFAYDQTFNNISYYEVVVMKLNTDHDGIPRLTKLNPAAWTNLVPYTSTPVSNQPYIAAKFRADQLPWELNIGGKDHIGGFYNGPLPSDSFFVLFVRGLVDTDAPTPTVYTSDYVGSQQNKLLPEFFHTLPNNTLTHSITGLVLVVLSVTMVIFNIMLWRLGVWSGLWAKLKPLTRIRRKRRRKEEEGLLTADEDELIKSTVKGGKKRTTILTLGGKKKRYRIVTDNSDTDASVISRSPRRRRRTTRKHQKSQFLQVPTQGKRRPTTEEGTQLAVPKIVLSSEVVSKCPVMKGTLSSKSANRLVTKPPTGGESEMHIKRIKSANINSTSELTVAASEVVPKKITAQESMANKRSFQELLRIEELKKSNPDAVRPAASEMMNLRMAAYRFLLEKKQAGELPEGLEPKEVVVSADLSHMAPFLEKYGYLD